MSKMGDIRFTLFGGVNNFTNQKPQVATWSNPVSIVGRTMYMGARVKIH